MNKYLVAVTAAVVALGTAIPAVAAVNVRQIDQRRRIDAGARSGKLSGHELARLRTEQNLITRAKLRMKAHHGGHLTDGDKMRIHEMQDAAERHIGHLKSNRAHGHTHVL